MRTHPHNPGCRSTRHVRQGGISENRTIIDNRTLFIESFLPHSGSVFPELAEELAGYGKSSGALRFPVDQPLPVNAGPILRGNRRSKTARSMRL
jgi:hypothetical protein